MADPDRAPSLFRDMFGLLGWIIDPPFLRGGTGETLLAGEDVGRDGTGGAIDEYPPVFNVGVDDDNIDPTPPCGGPGGRGGGAIFNLSSLRAA
mmetsp:Transcript_43257/g.60706  ORF Transcript_43257/g.60706 Transcript_43257/m.60706 type:complete len:93 (+) Transcript_43257:324-602(+)